LGEGAAARFGADPASPRQCPRNLAAVHIGPSQLDGFFHGQPLGPGEEDVLAKILYRFSRLGLDNVEYWRRKDATWDQVAAAPSDFRGEIFHLRGRAIRVAEHRLLPELAELFEFDRYYRVTLAIDDSPYQALVCTREVPSAWKVGQPVDRSLDEPASADGLFLKLGEVAERATAPQLVFAAGRVAWRPDRADPAAHLGPDQLALSQWGFDLGLFDAVRAANGRGIGDADREAFYQLLAAIGRAPPGGLSNAPAIDLVSLLEHPAEQHGKFVAVQGIARRVTKVQVSDQDVQRRFGIDHYYEIDLFLPVGDKTLRFGKGDDSPVYANTYPATLIALRLPPELAAGDNRNDSVRADAVFMKVWSYRAAYTSQFNRVQPAPLLFTVRPVVVAFERGSNVVSGVLVAGAFVVAGLVIGIIFWWYRGSDQEAERARRRERTGEGRPAPDFTNL
jgi:hypothetical protein